MTTIARDPDSLKTTLPPGGKPSWDDAYLEWARAFCRQAEVACLLADDTWTLHPFFRVAAPKPPECPLNVWRLTGHLFKWLNGEVSYPEGINYSHRLRYVGVQFHYRSQEIKAEAERYFDRLLTKQQQTTTA